jgi:hypothetical protein
MGGTTGTPTPAGQTSTGNATINNQQLNWPEWATNLAAQQPASPMAPAGSTGVSGTLENLGFGPTAPPSTNATAAPTGFGAAPISTAPAGGLAHLGAAPPPPPPAAAPTAPGVTQADLDAQLGKPRNPVYEDTQVAAYTLPGGTYGTTGVQAPGTNAPGVGYVDPKAFETFGQGAGPYMDPRLDPYYAASSGKPALTPGAVLTPGQEAGTPHMSKALYDFNMNAYGNPYGPAQASADKALYDRLLSQYAPQPAQMGGGA